MDPIQARILKLGKKMLEKLKNNIFGDSQEGKFKVGEIIRWQAWEVTEENVLQIYKYGVLMKVFDRNIDNRSIKVAEILPFGEEKTIKISLILVKKSDLED